MLRRVIPVLLFGIGGFAMLVWLGVWQVQRLGWKTEMIERIDARITAPPVGLPAEPVQAADQYLRLRLSGRIGPEELHVYTSVPPRGVGYRVIAPLVLENGRRILLDRGFVLIEQKDAARLSGRVTVEGSLLWPYETDAFTSAPDLDRNIWFARDTDAMATALGTEPVLLVASASDDPVAPMPLPVTVDIPNNHLQYALTWFLIAAGWLGMTAYALWRIKRRTF